MPKEEGKKEADHLKATDDIIKIYKSVQKTLSALLKKKNQDDKYTQNNIRAYLFIIDQLEKVYNINKERIA